MKKRILVCITLLAVFCLICMTSIQFSKIIGHDGLITKARKEIENLAEVETIEMTIAGKSTVDNNRHLFWIITGNENQTHTYYPLEVIEIDNEIYKFVHLYNCPLQRGQDIFAENFGEGYSFVINNTKCKGIEINGTIVPVTSIPFVYYYPSLLIEYYFLDVDGNKLN